MINDKLNSEPVKNVLIVLSLCLGLFASITSWAILPYRVTKAEEALVEARAQEKKLLDTIYKLEITLIRIESRLERIERQSKIQ